MPRQSRTANPVNEITDITNAVGPAWAVPAYSAAGNMTTIPQPKDPTKAYAATYDAWNRLVKLEEHDGEEGHWTVQENQYDARRFRTVQKNYEEGELTETRRGGMVEGTFGCHACRFGQACAFAFASRRKSMQ